MTAPPETTRLVQPDRLTRGRSAPGRSRSREGFFLRSLAAVPAEHTGGSEFAQLMTDHFFRNVHAQMRATVMNQKRVADEVGRDRRTPRPGLDRLLGIRAHAA